jgi:hypothetical protein
MVFVPKKGVAFLWKTFLQKHFQVREKIPQSALLNKVTLSVQINMKADRREIYGAPIRIHGKPTGAAVVFMMRPTTAPSASTS